MHNQLNGCKHGDMKAVNKYHGIYCCIILIVILYLEIVSGFYDSINTIRDSVMFIIEPSVSAV